LNQLRNIILNHKNLKKEDVNRFTMSVIYLDSFNCDLSAQNAVGYGIDKKVRIVFLNDLIIQFYPENSKIDFNEVAGLNSKSDFRKFLNVNESRFVLKIFNNETRMSYLENLSKKSYNVKMDAYKETFKHFFFETKGFKPNVNLVNNFLIEIASGKEINNFLKDRIYKILYKHLGRKETV